MVRALLGGLGMLMYGMMQMEELMKKSVKGQFQRMLKKYTKNKRTSWLVGIGMTGITQSSSLVSLLVVVFVGAGLFTIQSGIAMVVGANIGTTFTSLFIARVGFGKWSISAIALPLVALGGLGSIFLPSGYWKRIAGIGVSLGLIFLGIDFLKDAVGSVSAGIDLAHYESYGIIGFFLIGVVITTIIQSSHTVVILTLTALYSGIITVPMALGIVIGSNIGTTTTVIIASLGGSYTKRQVAFAHLGFNCILSVIGLLYRQPIYNLSYRLLGKEQNIAIYVALFNTLLNTLTTLCVMPFLGQFMSHINTLFPNKPKKTRLHIQSITPLQVTSGSISQTTLLLIEDDLKIISKAVLIYSVALFKVDAESLELFEFLDDEAHKKQYDLIYEGLTHCDTLLQCLLSQELSKKQKETANELRQQVDMLLALLDSAKGIVKSIQHFDYTENRAVAYRFKELGKWIIKILIKHEKDSHIEKKYLKKIPYLDTSKMGIQEINHYDIVRMNDFLKTLFSKIVW